MRLSVERFKDNVVRVVDQLHIPKNLARGSGLSFALLIAVGVASPEPVVAGLVMQDNGCPVPQAPSNFRVDRWIDSDDGIQKKVEISWDAQDGDLGYYFQLDDYGTRHIDITFPNHPDNFIEVTLPNDRIRGASVFARNGCGWGSESTLTVTR